MNFKQKMIYMKEFGIILTARVFVNQIQMRLNGNNQSLQDKINEIKLERLTKEYSMFFKKKEAEWRNIEKSPQKRDCIWIFWYQGNMNDIPTLRMCNESIKKYKNPSTEIIYVNKNNLSNYIDMPQEILDKVEKGLISLTHLSDIVRFKLLAKWGGTWFDATMFATGFFEMIDSGKLWTIKRPNDGIMSISKGKWTGFAIGGSNDNILFYLMSEFFDKYWSEHNVLLDFFLIDLGIEYLYRNCSTVKADLDNISYNNVSVQKLWPKMNEIFDEDVFQSFVEETSLFKLSYRLPWKEKDNTGNITYYGRIMNEYD